MSNNAIIIPVHMEKINYFVSFINSLKSKNCLDYKPDFDIIMVATNYEEYRIFNRMKSAGMLLPSIRILDASGYVNDRLGFIDFSESYNSNKNRGIVNFKKFIGLHFASICGYETIACIDSDTTILGATDIFMQKLRVNYDKKCYYGAITADDFLRNVISSSIKFLTPQDQILIREKTRNDQIYHWFFDVPAYDGSDVKQFFHYMAECHGSLEAFFDKLSWNSFDNLIFSYWRCAVKEADIIDCSNIESPVPELQTYRDITRIRDKYDYEPCWLRAIEVFYQPDILMDFTSISLGYHFDRM